jgi:predicted RNA-binding protein with PIN domain
MVTTILDGYNVIHAVPELARQLDRSLQAAREALVRMCQEARGQGGAAEQFYVVFDGRDAHALGDAEQHHGRVTVCFTQRPEEADARILRVIDALRGHGPCVVVSNDHEVANNARAFGARSLSVQEFYAQAHGGSPRTLDVSTQASKVMPSTRDAHQITEDYRQYLANKGRI